jgi:NADH-quinone oxidoreductase subunit C
VNKIEQLQQLIQQQLVGKYIDLNLAYGELTLILSRDALVEVMQILRDDPCFSFQQCQDLCGVDYSTYRAEANEECLVAKRFAVVYHLLSLEHNWRLRVRVALEDDEFPRVPSLIELWSSVNWFEREAFDLYGIIFDGHPDLRRILTDYGFIGHPFRKDFPLSGYVEMHYDAEQQRVIYQPVTIEPREITPRIIREENYGGRD